MTRASNFVLPSFNTQYLMPTLVLPETDTKPVFSCKNPAAALKYSDPVKVVALFFNPKTNEIKAVGDDGNVRVCRADRLSSPAEAQRLMKTLKAVQKEAGIIRFETAGGFSPDKWFKDIVKA
jgi:hypothetical protein